MKLRISTEEENFVTIVKDLRACGHTGLADSIQQALDSFKTASGRTEETKQTESAHRNPWE